MIRANFFLTILFSILFLGCDAGGDEDVSGGTNPTEITPTNLSMTINIQGSSTNAAGDGSGKISINASATNAERYTFNFGTGDSIDSTTGLVDYTFTAVGENQYTVKVFAYSSTNHFISTSQTIIVLVSSPAGSNCGDDPNLLWCDEFEYTGTPDPSKWTMQIGTGNGGWGNDEAQYYTDRTNNLKVSDGTLKIIAKKEPYGGKQYTSGRIITYQKYDFTYGRIEIRAKLPSEAGTWPALWLLGSSFETNTWPLCGEMDIMEQFVDKSIVKSTMHWQNQDGTRAEYGEDKNIDNPTDFHIYEFDWKPGSVKTSVDGVQMFSMTTNNTMPFDENFFMILNLAMGGNKGAGPISPTFSEDILEIDYVRVYKN